MGKALMNRLKSQWKPIVVSLFLFCLLCFSGRQADSWATTSDPKAIAPAVSLGTGLLLEPPLDLSWVTKATFEAWMETVGQDKIRKEWTTPVVPLPELPPSSPNGLTHVEVKGYMQRAKQMFERGQAIPVSDVGLISTQEDVIRQPMLNHISAFANSAARVYLLVQKTASDQDWSYFSIVQDMTVQPPLDYYAQLFDSEVRFEGTSCYACHSSGPLAIHPAREDLVIDPKLASALSQFIATQPRSRFYFPPDSPKPDMGGRLTLDACTGCHAEDGDRGPLYRVHSHPIRVLVDFGYMPPGEKLSVEQIDELKAWLLGGR
jgi:hypothetical protein